MPYRSYLTPRPPFTASKKPRAAKQRHAAIVPRTGGRLTRSEKAIIAHIVEDTPGELTPDQVESTALILRRNPRTIAQAIAEARESLQANAARYVEIHLRAAEKALASGDQDTARKAAEWAIQHISARDEAGKVHRVIEGAEQQSHAPIVQIGIALGGMPKPANPLNES